MSGQVEISPGGVGFIRTKAVRPIPGAPKAIETGTVRRRSWIRGVEQKAAGLEKGAFTGIRISNPRT